MENFFKGLIDKKTLRILNLLFEHGDDLWHIKKISIESEVPLSTTFRIIKKFLRLNIVEKSLVGKLKIYKLAKNKKTDYLKRVLK
ncbi:helix-turn-helix domain-containing protein [Candidatus Woesearchaeota archaeon]|nr:helix-turn-helix domain-containing protein [Candidatus Woesearchaeota archaeon]